MEMIKFAAPAEQGEPSLKKRRLSEDKSMDISQPPREMEQKIPADQLCPLKVSRLRN